MLAVSRTLTASILAVALMASGAASAQSYGAPYGSPYGAPVVNRAGAAGDGYYDYARVVRVVPVAGVPQGYPAQGQRCTTRQGGYAGDYHGDYYGSDGYYPAGEAPRARGSEGGRTMASVLGSVLGAVIGSQVGGGSARYATAAVGSAVGGIAGRQVYENAHRGNGAVTVCDPVDARRPYAGPYAGNTGAYDVTYEYGGRTYMTRTAYDPGDRIRVRVDVHPE
jgi:hypothetical protein